MVGVSPGRSGAEGTALWRMVGTGLVQGTGTVLLGLLLARDAPGDELLGRAALDAAVLLPAGVLAALLAARLARAAAFGPGLPAVAGAGSLLSLLFLLLAPAAALVRAAVGPGALDAGASFLCGGAAVVAGAGASSTAMPPLLRAALEAPLVLAPLAIPTAFLAVALVSLAGARSLRRAAALAVATSALLATRCVEPIEAPAPGDEEPEGTIVALTACTGQVRRYEISAIPVRMTLNRFGDHDPGGFMYVLDADIPRVRAEEARPVGERVSSGLGADAIQPLAIRARLGECLELQFTNRLPDDPASLHLHGIPYAVESAGGAVGRNADSFAAPGESLTYRLTLPTDPVGERAYYFHDHGSSRQRVAHGLFGALVIEPAGSTWLDPRTGAPLTGSSWDAIIDMPAPAPDFREFVLMYHEIGDEAFTGIVDGSGRDLPQFDDLSNVYRPGSRAINYRSEPHMNRLEIENDKSQGYGSYMFGDPATPIPRSYLGEPTKTRLLHGGTEVLHVHHLHGGGNRWRRNPELEPSDFATGLRKVPLRDVRSIRLDSQSIGPGTSFNLEHECGAGGCQQAAGDFLFHCHIGHHYIGGMWSFWRVFDTLQAALATLPDRSAPPTAVDSRGLIGKVMQGKRLVPTARIRDPATEQSLQQWVEAQLPPRGVRFDREDATVWDWQHRDEGGTPIYYGEPEDRAVWPNFRSPTPGARPRILFNPVNGRYAWPLLRPHLGKRPPFSPNGHSGAPWLGQFGTASRPDGVCPNHQVAPNPFRQVLEYPISAIETPVQITRSRVDPGGLLFVLNEHKDDVLAGRRLREPLAIRSNVGDCVNLLFTNEISDSEFNGFHSKSNMHTHLVQFDPQGSDGTVTGFSFEQSVRPYLTEERTLTSSAPRGTRRIRVTHTRNLRPGVFIGVGLGTGMCPLGAKQVPCTEVRRITAMDQASITLDKALLLGHAAGEAVGVEFVRYAWYSDVDSGAVFWHDHVNFRSWWHGLFATHVIEPTGSTWLDPTTGQPIRAGTLADIHAPPTEQVGAGVSGPFRELVLFLHDSNPVAEATFNLRAEPLAERPEEALAFSSVRHGDPVTPLLRAYVGDPLVIRGVGVTEMVGGLRLLGHRFRTERFDAEAPTADTVLLGISERYDLVVDGGAGGPAGMPGDYLYYSTQASRLEAGAWGLLRVHDRLRPELRPLPGRPAPAAGPGFPSLGFSGGVPAAASSPGTPCPVGAPVKRFPIQLGRSRITYHLDETDSNGVVFAPGSAGLPRTTAQPLVLRVNAGDCLELAFTNHHDRPAAPTLSLLLQDPQGSFGPAVGFNPDSTTPPGGTRLYRFFADQQLGTALLFDLAARSQIGRGAFGAVIVEPPGSSYRHPVTGAPLTSGIRADVITPRGSFREFVTLFQDEDPRIGQNDMPYPTEVKDVAAVSYTANPFASRDAVGRPEEVFSSLVHGDPRLVFAAQVGDDVTFRVGQPWGEQLHVFSVDGHYWPQEYTTSVRPTSLAEELAAVPFLPGQAFDCALLHGAGGSLASPADYLFLDHRAPFTEAGLWGLLRVHPPGGGGIRPLPPPAP